MVIFGGLIYSYSSQQFIWCFAKITILKFHSIIRGSKNLLVGWRLRVCTSVSTLNSSDSTLKKRKIKQRQFTRCRYRKIARWEEIWATKSIHNKYLDYCTFCERNWARFQTLFKNSQLPTIIKVVIAVGKREKQEYKTEMPKKSSCIDRRTEENENDDSSTSDVNEVCW